MRRSYVLTLSVMLVGASACESGGAGPITAEEYAVYSALLDSMYSDTPYVRLVVYESTQSVVPPPEPAEGEVPEPGPVEGLAAMQRVPRSLLREFKRTNSLSYPLAADSFRTRLDVTLLQQADHDSILGEPRDNWQEFYDRFPNAGGFIVLTRVAFSRDGRRALLNVDLYCGWLCGAGHGALLEKRRGRWIVAQHDMWWVS